MIGTQAKDVNYALVARQYKFELTIEVVTLQEKEKECDSCEDTTQRYVSSVPIDLTVSSYSRVSPIQPRLIDAPHTHGRARCRARRYLPPRLRVTRPRL